MKTLAEEPVVKEPGTLTDLEDLIRPHKVSWRDIVYYVILASWSLYIGYNFFGETAVRFLLSVSFLPILLYLAHRERERQRWFLALVAMRAMSREIKELRAAKL